jgi:hypothetical protein
MSARTTATIFVAVFLGATIGLAIRVSAEEPKREPPTAGARPVEDPTIYEREPQEDQPEDEPDVEGDSEPEARPETETQPDEHQTPAEQLADDSEPESDQDLTGAGPVEDPTLDIATEPDEEPPEEAPKEEAKKPDVRVDYDNGLLLSINDWFYLALSGLVQARYTINYRTTPPVDPITMELDKQVTQGFDVPRARFTLGIGLTEFVALVVRLGVVAGGDFEFQRAFIDLKWKYFRLRAGLFMNELNAESLVNPWDLFFADYSIVDNVYTPGSSKGIMMTYLRKRFSINLGYSDGLRTGFSEIRSAANADYALTLRAQYAWGKRGLAGFNRLNARRGTPLGIRLGAALHYQDGGRTQGSLPAKVAVGTIDLSVRGNGWSALFSGIVGQDATDATESLEAGEVISGGVTVMGGYFVLEDLQVFGQYSVVAKPKIQGMLPPASPGISGTPSNFQAFGVGASYFVIPNFDNVKVTTDFQYFLGQEAGSLVPSSPLNSVQPNDAGSQFAWRLQISGAF